MDELEALEVQEFAVRFTPTALEFMGPSSLAVAGCMGDTFVVEVWELRAPIEMMALELKEMPLWTEYLGLETPW